MNERHKPVEQEIPKYKSKSKKKGQPRADHKHEYKKVVVHSWWQNPFKQNVKDEHIEVCNVCTICGRIGDYITARFFQTEEFEYDIKDLEHWYVDDYFDKFAKKLEELNG